MTKRPRIVAFDIIGTVFSMEPMRAELVALGLQPLALELLYTIGLRDTLALACTNDFAPFQSVLAGCLDEVLSLEGLSVSPERKRAILGMMKALPPHEDARAAFELLRDAGIRIAALSNGAAKTTKGLLEAANLDGFVELVLSVEDVKLSKPRPEVYLYAAQAAGVATGEMALVATHPWDVHGARMADLTGAYVARGRPFPSVLRSPNVSGESLLDVARALVALG
jgi:2-haloacid dehalogenase